MPDAQPDLHHELRDVVTQLARIAGQLDVWTPVWTAQGHGLTDMQNRLTIAERRLAELEKREAKEELQESTIQQYRVQTYIAMIAAAVSPVLTVILERIANGHH